MRLGFDAKGVDELIASFGSVKTNLTKELGIVAWETAKKCESVMAKEIAMELNVKPKEIKSHIIAKRKPLAASEVILYRNSSPFLKSFKPSNTRSGVRATVLKSKGQQAYPNTFMAAVPGKTKSTRLWGHAWYRDLKKPKTVVKSGTNKGKLKHRIVKQRGFSPGVVFEHNNMIKPTMEKTRDELRKQLAERIRWNNVKRTLPMQNKGKS